MVNGNSEKGLGVNSKVKTVIFPGDKNEKILDDIINQGKARRSHSSCWN